MIFTLITSRATWYGQCCCKIIIFFTIIIIFKVFTSPVNKATLITAPTPVARCLLREAQQGKPEGMLRAAQKHQ